jgi:hypothetical protein
LKRGCKINELLALLQNRLSHPIPPLLEIALRSWAGESFAVELEAVTVMRCPEERVFRAVITSPLMQPLLKGYLYPDLLFVDSNRLEALRQRLHWLGWKVTDQLQIISS